MMVMHSLKCCWSIVSCGGEEGNSEDDGDQDDHEDQRDGGHRPDGAHEKLAARRRRWAVSQGRGGQRRPAGPLDWGIRVRGRRLR